MHVSRLTNLCLNEHQTDIPFAVKSMITNKCLEQPWHKYPTNDVGTRTLLGRYYGVDPDAVLIGPGSFPLIDLAIRCIGRQHVVAADPSFEEYQNCTIRCGKTFIPWRLKLDFSFDWNFIDEVPSGSLIIICSPNNPTGSMAETRALKRILSRRSDCYFLIDEAYADFCEQSFLQLVTQYQNIIVSRSFSKSHGLAGVRAGFLAAAPNLIEKLKSHVTPFWVHPLVCPTIEVLVGDSQIADFFDLKRSRLQALRKKQCDTINSLGSHIKAINCPANFYLLKANTRGEIETVRRQLAHERILVKGFRSDSPLSCHLRLSVAEEGTHRKIIQIIKSCGSRHIALTWCGVSS